MQWFTKVRHLPPRLVIGAFILNSGLDKRQPDDETAKQLHGMASRAYPFLAQQDPQRFVRTLSTAEITLGSALLLPVVPTAAAAAGLTAFSTGLVGLYLRTPGTRRPGSIRPTSDGVPLAKDAWLLGTALGLLLDAVTDSGQADSSRTLARRKRSRRKR